jgi:hypothetical protein
MDPKKPEIVWSDATPLGDQESKRNPGRYVSSRGYFIDQAPGEAYRSKFASIFAQGKIDLRHHAEQAVDMNFGQWVEMCRDGGPWDFEADASMQDGVEQGLYTRDLLISFRRFHAGFTGAALGLRAETACEWMKHPGFDPSDAVLRKDFGLGWNSYWSGSFDQPRNEPFFRWHTH